jgi:hypothetical protein
MRVEKPFKLLSGNQVTIFCDTLQRTNSVVTDGKVNLISEEFRC